MNKAVSVGIKRFLSGNIVCFIAFFAALITCFFVVPDKEYLDYIDLRTITCLFCMMSVISALRNVDFFRILACKIIKIFANTRSAITALVFITYFGSMLIANDMALITFLPLGYLVLSSADKKRYMAFTFIMQNIAANLGGMLTPFGNPQNLFLYNFYNIPTGEFFGIMYIPFLAALLLIILCCVFVKKEPLSQSADFFPDKKHKLKTSLYLALFAYSIVIVFRVVPFWTGLFMIPIIIIADKKALLQVDYMLLLTFVFFFIFAGNMARIPAVKNFISSLTERDTLLTAIASCQIISNVPSAILLSSFTDNYKALLMAVNIGGCGTLVSSLA
ncbi:MAG: SLC13 family permease, partial [Christensenellales bacterium]